MTYTYKVQENNGIVVRTDEIGNTCSIPINLANADYQEYLKSLDETPTL
jgi:hypothetical protein